MGGVILLLLISSGIAGASPTAAAQNELGVALQREGDLFGAIRAFRQAIELDPKFGAAMANLGHALREAGNVQESIACFQRVALLEPGSGAAHADLGHALSRNDQLREAVAELRKAIALAPKFASAHFLLAETLSRAGQNAAALPEYEAAATLSPDNAEFLTRYGSALSRTKPQAAVSPLRRAVSLDPSSHIARQALGLALQRTGDQAGAAREFEQARTLAQSKDRRNEAETLTNRGIELLSAGSVPEALTIFEKALAIEPALAVAHHYRALALSSAGRFEEANQDFAEALRQSPSDPEIHYN